MLAIHLILFFEEEGCGQPPAAAAAAAAAQEMKCHLSARQRLMNSAFV
jgi:hypothetical protein